MLDESTPTVSRRPNVGTMLRVAKTNAIAQLRLSEGAIIEQIFRCLLGAREWRADNEEECVHTILVHPINNIVESSARLSAHARLDTTCSLI